MITVKGGFDKKHEDVSNLDTSSIILSLFHMIMVFYKGCVHINRADLACGGLTA